MLCRDNQIVTPCQLEFADTHLVLRFRGTWRELMIEFNSITELIFDETMGRLMIYTRLQDSALEISPQSIEDLDSVSRILAVMALSENPSVLDRVEEFLKIFGDVTSGIIKLVALLQEVDVRGGINWNKISEVAGEITEAVNMLSGKVPGFHNESFRSLMNSIESRHIKEVIRRAEAVLTHVYNASRSSLTGLIPGTCSEVLLDLVLLYVLTSSTASKRISVSERGLVTIREVSEVALARYANVFGVQESHLVRIRELIRDGVASVGEFIREIMDALRSTSTGFSRGGNLGR